MEAVLNNLYVVAYALRKIIDTDFEPTAQGMLDQICSTHTLCSMYMLQPMLEHLGELNLRFQARDVDLQEVDEYVQHARKCIRSNYLHSTYAFECQDDVPENMAATHGMAHSWNRLHSVLRLKTLLAIDEDGCIGFQYSVEGQDTFIRLRHSTQEGQKNITRDASHQDLKAAFKALQPTYKSIANSVLADMRERFPPSPLMRALSMVHPAYWKRFASQTFDTDLKNIIKYFAQPRVQYTDAQTSASQGQEEATLHSNEDFDIDGQAELDASVTQQAGRQGKMVQPILDEDLLLKQKVFFMEQAKQTSAPDTCKTVQDLWRALTTKESVHRMLSEYVKLAQIYLCIPVTSVENERDFSDMNYIKDEVRNCLQEPHLNACMHIKQCTWTLQSLPVADIYDRWLQAKTRRMLHK